MYILSAASNTATVEVKGPDGIVFLISLAILFIIPAIYFIFRYFRKNRIQSTASSTIFSRKKITIELEKDRKYYPDFVKISIKNTGKKDIDLDQPLLIFRNFWTKRKFKLKGTNRYSFYPLLLEPGKTHDLTIDLNHFYRHDKQLKRYPQITVMVFDVNGKKFPPRSIMLRKTLFR